MRVLMSFWLSICVLCTGAVNAQQLPGPNVAVAAALQPFIERQELAGAVALVADMKSILSITAVGAADRESGKPMRADSMFWIASQSKPITAAAVMILVDEGRITLDDPVEKYLPEFRGLMAVAEKDEQHVLLKKPERPITVRQTLAHTSGMPFRSAQEVPVLDRLSLADRVRSYAMTPLDFVPESRYQYSNAGINTAARIVEVVSGLPFEQFLAERLLQPLGMLETTFWPDEAQAARIATAYRPGAGGIGLEATKIEQLQYPLTDRLQRTAMPAGGLFSTAADVSRFYRMLANGGELDGRRVLSEAAIQQLTTRQTPTALKESYGLGFSVSEDRFGHGGAYSTNSYYDHRNQRVLIWLVQHAGFPGRGGDSQAAFRTAALAPQ